MLIFTLLPACTTDGTPRESTALSDTVRVETGMLVGRHNEGTGVRAFKGVPYAQPPAGPLRWRAPRRIEPWEGVANARAFASTCMQDPPPEDSFYRLEFFENVEPMSEDCLYLNVWTAARSTNERRPVMMWIHGGAFRQGSGSTPSFDGESLAKKGVVVVTTNYRLGAFGLLAHPDLSLEADYGASGNYGLLDQIAALQWIHRNIASFGGDPEKVTLFGQSSGASSVNALMTSPLAAGTFHRAILQSGSSFAFGRNPTLEEAEQTGEEFAIAADARSARALRNLPADTVLARGRSFGFRPNVDGYVLPGDVRRMFREVRQANVALLAGATSHEGTTLFGPGLTAEVYRDLVGRRYGDDADHFLELYPAATDEEAKRMFNAGFRDEILWGAHTVARLHTKNTSAPSYLYYFTRVPPGRDGARYGAYHSSELVYVFDNLEAVDRPWTTADRWIADRMATYWTNFADSGNPNGDELPLWPVYDASNRQVLAIGDTLSTLRVLDPDVVSFYNDRLENTRAP